MASSGGLPNFSEKPSDIQEIMDFFSAPGDPTPPGTPQNDSNGNSSVSGAFLDGETVSQEQVPVANHAFSANPVSRDEDSCENFFRSTNLCITDRDTEQHEQRQPPPARLSPLPGRHPSFCDLGQESFYGPPDSEDFPRAQGPVLGSTFQNDTRFTYVNITRKIEKFEKLNQNLKNSHISSPPTLFSHAPTPTAAGEKAITEATVGPLPTSGRMGGHIGGQNGTTSGLEPTGSIPAPGHKKTPAGEIQGSDFDILGFKKQIFSHSDQMDLSEGTFRQNRQIFLTTRQGELPEPQVRRRVRTNSREENATPPAYTSPVQGALGDLMSVQIQANNSASQALVTSQNSTTADQAEVSAQNMTNESSGAVTDELSAFLSSTTVPSTLFGPDTSIFYNQPSLNFDSFSGCQLEPTVNLANVEAPRMENSMIEFSPSPANPTVSNSTFRADGGIPLDPSIFNTSRIEHDPPRSTHPPELP